MGVRAYSDIDRREIVRVIAKNAILADSDNLESLNDKESLVITSYSIHYTKLYDPVVVSEVQTGEYFGEDDIERFEDDFGRV